MFGHCSVAISCHTTQLHELAARRYLQIITSDVDCNAAFSAGGMWDLQLVDSLDGLAKNHHKTLSRKQCAVRFCRLQGRLSITQM